MSLADARPTSAAAPSAAASSVERETTNLYGNCKPEFIPMLETLLLTYDQTRTRMKPKHKRQNKQIHSLRQGYDGIKCRCYRCKQEIDTIENAEIHHLGTNPLEPEKNKSNPFDNRIISTDTIHGNCNRQLNGKQGGQVNKERAAAHYASFSNVTPAYVRENPAPARTDANDYGGSQWTSREGRKHDIMRPKWDALLWTLFNPENEDVYYIGKGKLANFARSADFVGTGTSTTFYKMIAEDVACGILKEDIETDTQAEIVRMVWPTPGDQEKLRALALQYHEQKITKAELDEAIKGIAAPRKETRPYWNYLRWYIAKKLRGIAP